jgi:hypothetical protein
MAGAVRLLAASIVAGSLILAGGIFWALSVHTAQLCDALRPPAAPIAAPAAAPAPSPEPVHSPAQSVAATPVHAPKAELPKPVEQPKPAEPVKQPEPKLVPPAFPLAKAGRPVKVVLFAEKEPTGQFDTAEPDRLVGRAAGSALGALCKKNKEAVEVVAGPEVERFLAQNPSARANPAQAAAQFGADYAVRVTVYQFLVYEPGGRQTFHGRAGATVAVFPRDGRAREPEFVREYSGVTAKSPAPPPSDEQRVGKFRDGFLNQIGIEVAGLFTNTPEANGADHAAAANW